LIVGKKRCIFVSVNNNKKMIMKKIMILICAAACVLSACCTGGSKELNFKNFKERVGETDGKLVYSSVASIDFPVDGDKKLAKAIREWIVSYSQGKLHGDNYQKYVANIAQKIFDKPNSPKNAKGNYENSLEINLLCDTTKYVTMTSLVYHSAGSWYGAHKSVGATFRKSDCKMFDSQMIDPNNLLDLKRLIVAHMPEALCIDGSKNVFDYLNKDALENVDGQRLVKLPGAFMPYIDGDGNVVVTYGLQEIAAYDFGEVEVVIPKDDILPLLTEDGKMFF
jgi:hypothetical protein